MNKQLKEINKNLGRIEWSILMIGSIILMTLIESGFWFYIFGILGIISGLVYIKSLSK